jgi:hypothetical protein
MNLEKIYEIVTKRDKKINSLYNDLGKYKELFENILCYMMMIKINN